MIVFIVQRGHTYTVKNFLNSEWSKEVRDQIKVLPYDRFDELKGLAVSCLIFTDHERFTFFEKQVVIRIWKWLRQNYPDLCMWNDPSKVVIRRPLLRTLYEEGYNDFNVFDKKELKEITHYPVFIRSIKDHMGPLTPLLYSETEVKEALSKFSFPRGPHLPKNLLIEQFLDTSNQEGLYHTYGAFRMGPKVIPRHFRIGEKWAIKNNSAIKSEENYLDQKSYILSNPHRLEILRIFQKANIDYGRIDYSIYNGRIQTWEINTNPLIGSMPRYAAATEEWPADIKKARTVTRQLFYKYLNDAFHDLFKVSKKNVVQKLPVYLILYLAAVKLERILTHQIIGGRVTNIYRKFAHSIK